jgi:hypothetical protein
MKESRTLENENHPASGNHIPWLEWLASGLGLLMALCVFGFIGWQALHDATSPPMITVTAIETTQVRIEGAVPGSDGPEFSSVTLDYIPGHSARKGGLFFTLNPQSEKFTLRAAGFAKP